jgi:hypothetical protein
MIKSMTMENLLGSLGIFIKEITTKMKEMVMEKCISLMEPYIKETGLEDCKLGKLL